MVGRSFWLGLGALLLVSAAVGTPALGQDGGAAPSAEEAAAEDQAAAFRRELRGVEEQVGDLKERVFRSKATLELLKELVIDSAVSGSHLVLEHVNKLGGAYSMESFQYFLDGKSIYSKVDPSGALDAMRQVKVAEMSLPPGAHNLQVDLVLRGKGFKVFSYLRTYQFKVTSSYAFTLQESTVTSLRAVITTKSGLRSFVERPTIQYDERAETVRDEQ